MTQDVIIAVGTTTNKYYHTNPNCSNLPETHTTKSLAGLPDRYQQCKVCTGEYNRPESQRRGLRARIESGDIDI